MKHIKPTAKGDPLCPLGFHPQVRWPTRCKRCFRDYKEHGNRNKQSDATLRRDDTTASTPALSSWTLPLKSVNDRGSSEIAKSWTSSSNLNSTENDSKTSNNSNTRFSKSSSWMSTPDLASASDDNKEVASSVTLTRRRRPEPTDTGQDDAVSSDYRSTQFTVRRRTSNSSLVLEPEAATTSTTTTNNSLRTRNTYANSVDTPTVSSLRSRVSSARSYVDNSSPPNVNVTVHLKAPKSSSEVSKVTSVNSVESSSSSSASGSSSSDEDDYETVSQGTDTTIIADPEYQNELQSLRQELEIMRGRCEKAELEKNDLLLKRLASMDTSSSKTTASELLKFQQKVNELKTMVEDLQDEKKVLTTRCRELDVEVQAYKKKGFADKETEVLRNKLSAAESLCEELMDENEEMKRELREMEVEMDEMQDHFREDQADEYSSLKKELEQTAKNCRILSFKLRKTERRADQMEAEKLEAEKKYREIAGEQDGMDKVEKIKKLEKELSLSTEVVNRLQKDLDEANSKLKELSSGKSQETRKKAPTLASLNRNSSGEKISRESLTRGGSQDDPVQLLRDLQDSLEREADLREQLRNAEEEISPLHKDSRNRIVSCFLRPPMRDVPTMFEEESTASVISKFDIAVQTDLVDILAAEKAGRQTFFQTSTSSQTHVTRLTALVSQMKTLAIQTELNVDAQIQTLWETNNNFAQTDSFDISSRSVGTSDDSSKFSQTDISFESCGLRIVFDQYKLSSTSSNQNENEFVQTEVFTEGKHTQTNFYATEDKTVQTNEDSSQDFILYGLTQNSWSQTETLPDQEKLAESEPPLCQITIKSFQNTAMQTEIWTCDRKIREKETIWLNEECQTEIRTQDNFVQTDCEQNRRQLELNSYDMEETDSSVATDSDKESENSASSSKDCDSNYSKYRSNNLKGNLKRVEVCKLCQRIKIEHLNGWEVDISLEQNGGLEAYSQRRKQSVDKFDMAARKSNQFLRTDRMTKFLQHLPPVLSFRLLCSNFGTAFSPSLLDSPLTLLISPSVARRHSPNSVSRLSAESANEKDEGISDEEDPAELRLLLELNEQEAAVLRRKVEDLESEGDGMKKKIADLQEKLLNKSNSLKKEKKAASLKSAEPKTDSSSTVYDKKLKVLEEEINELRKKLIEKERDCERLHSELALTKKKPKTLQKSISLDGASESIDLKRQLQNVEQEASILRTKNQTLEMDYEKLLAENKKLQLSKGSKKGGLLNSSQFELKGKIAALEKELEEANKKIQQFEGSKNGSKSSNDLSEVDKLKSQISKLESEKSILKRLKEDPVTDSVKLYLKRTPKKPTDLMAKSQLKKMVEDLENEISEILVVLQKSDVASAKVLESGKSDVEKTRLKKEVEELKKNLEATKREVIDQKAKFDKEKEKLSTEKKNIQNDRKKIENLLEQEKKKLESEKQVIEAAKKKLELDKTELNAEITRLNSEIKALTTNTQEKGKQFESLKKQLEAEKKSVEILRQNLEGMKALEEENNKLKKELKDISQKSAEYEIKLKELEDKHKKSEKLLSAKKEKVSKLEKQLEEAVSARKSLESSQTKISADFQIEKDELLKKVEQLSTEKEDLSLEMQRKQGNLISLEKQLKEEKEKFINLSSKADATVSAELKRTREELTLLKKQNIDLHTKLAESERKMKDRMKISYEQENKCKEAEISNLHNKMSQQGLNRRLSEVRLEYDKQLEKVEQSLTEERKNYEELTAKYEQLEQEHVATKSQFVMEKETLLSRLAVNEQEARSLESELRALRETYNKKQDEWIKEKLEIQERVKALERNQEKATDSDILQIQLNTLNATLNEKLSEIDQLQRENSMKLNQLENVKKENEELKKKLEDYVKVSKVQRSMSADSSALDRELREVKNRLYMEERARKSDLSALKLRYDSRIQIIMEELKNAQGQVSRFKRESDNYRHMFESAQKTIADLKGGARGSTRSSEQGEDIEEQVTALEQQLSLLEDELSEARLEGSRLKTELISNKSAFEVKVSEMASRINELEEERLLSSGRAKIPGLKTKLELAWSKEREEQQRILQETSTLARDLRQTLFEMERERDKDRLEAKRKNELLRKTMEEEQEENKRKITELQCDLLELRDAHAKLRTTNEKLRREKERFDQEKETLRKIKSSLLEDPKLSRILDLCNELTAMIPELTGKPNTTIGLVTPPVRRKGPKSRESSPSLEKAVSSRESSMARDDPRVSRMQVIMQQLSEITHDLRRSQRMSEDDKRALFSRRSASTESENPAEPPSYRKGVQRRGSLYRKSLSLEQTSQSVMAANEKIWKMEDDNGSYSSFQSLDEAPEPKFNMYQQIDSSLDSRLSGDSTQSERVGAGEKKKKKGILGKLRKLTKSSSVDHEPEYEYTSRSQVNPGSDTSLASHGNPELESHQNKRNFKSRISDMFKKSGSTSRGNSMERTMGLPPSGSSVMSDSAMRPLTRTSPSPARSDVSSSSASRPLIGSNGKPMTAPGSVPLPRKVNNKK
nr:PREDICTED: centromere protein F-like isoform X2 [Bemisia tabaci]